MLAGVEGDVNRAEHACVDADHVARGEQVCVDLAPTFTVLLPDHRVLCAGHVALERAPRLLFVKEPDQTPHEPHEKQDDGGEYIRFALRPGKDVDKKREDGECEQQRGERVEE